MTHYNDVRFGEGDCYQAALDLFFGLRPGWPKLAIDARLVHGAPRLQREPFERFGHAWVEWEPAIGLPLVYDFSNGREVIVPAVLYYRLGDIDPRESRSYSHAEAREFILRFEHYGPWEGPWAPTKLPERRER